MAAAKTAAAIRDLGRRGAVVAVSGVPPHEAGAASSLLTVMQQVGGSIGTALLSTLAIAATNDFAGGHGPWKVSSGQS